MPQHPLRRHGLAALGVLLLVGTALLPPTPAHADPDVPSLDWQPCAGELATFDCAEVEVPTDYDDPDGPTTTIALTRLPAAEPEQRIGSLFVNPGGPGGSGVDFVQQSAPLAYTPEVRARFDIVGFDPRATNRSDPATCFRTAEDEAAFSGELLPFPLTEAEEQRYLGRTARLGTRCLATSKDRFEHSSTANVARDLDLLRQAVGDQQLSYAGYSYGTFLGATYAQLFPDTIRALVLDGTLEPRSYTGVDGDPRSVGARIGQGPAAAEVFDEFLRLCAEAGPDGCALAGQGDPATVAEQTFERLKTEPVTLDLGEGLPPLEVSYAVAVALVFSDLYAPALWTSTAELLALLSTGGTGAEPAAPAPALAAHVRESVQQLSRGGEDYPSLGGSLASTCVDTVQPPAPQDYDEQADAEDAAAPDFGRYRSWVGFQCEFLRVADEDAYTGDWQQQSEQPVLVIGTRFDPATPYSATEPYASLWPEPRVVTLEGWGHTALGQSSCTDQAVTDYLIEPGSAAPSTTCATEVVPFTTPPEAAELALSRPVDGSRAW